MIELNDKALAELIEQMAEALNYWTQIEADKLTEAGKSWTHDHNVIQHRTLLVQAEGVVLALRRGNWTTGCN
jgi:hypothetical protein